LTFVERSQFAIADILSGSTALPLVEIMYPKNFVLITENSLF
jgi:hypothetical protein